MNVPEPGLDEPERDDAVIGVALKWSVAVIVLVAACGIGAWYFLVAKPAQPSVVETKLNEVPLRETVPLQLPKVPFEDITQTAGINFKHESGAYGDKLLPETMGGGCAFFDYDNDGDQDLLMVNSQRWAWDMRQVTEPATHKFYRNDAGQFADISEESGLGISQYGMGVAVGDYDNDGNVDVFISGVGASRLFRNTGDKKFVDVTESAGVQGDPNQWTTGCGWFDYDNDGDLDLFVLNYVKWTKEFDLAQKFQLLGGDERAYGRPQPFEGTFPYLYRNDGKGKFTDVAESAGLHVKNANTGVPAGKSLGLAFADLDSDGWLDVIVANDTVQNFLFHNQRNGKFKEIGVESGIAFDMSGAARGAMGIDVAHFRNNKAIGVAIGNFSNEMTALYVAGDAPLQFSDEAVSTGLGPTSRLDLKFGVCFLDIDLDGRLDLLEANGHLEEEINRVQKSQHYEQPPHLFWNCGPEHGTEFLPLTAAQCGERFFEPTVGRGASFADIDNDGDLDLLIATTGRSPKLLRNDQKLGHHWLRLKLVGKKSNRDAIGAQVTVAAGGRKMYQQVMPTRSYLSQVELPLTFGLGDDEVIEQITILWPSGAKTELKSLAIDKLHVIEETN